MKLSVSDNQRFFLSEDAPAFLLADTCWSAFTHPSFEEWKKYLNYRKAQGFNAIQMNALQQCHSCMPKKWRHPFEVTDKGEYDYSRIREDYFERACCLLDEMMFRGMVPMIVLVWGNYAPDTMQQTMMGQRAEGASRHVEKKPYLHPMTMDEMRGYVRYAVERFRKYNPIFIVCGDVNLNEGRDVVFHGSLKQKVFGNSSQRLNEFYLEAIRITKELAPECLATYHLNPQMRLPKCFLEDGKFDFYMYQPGHSIDFEAQTFNRTLAREIKEYPLRRPVLNSETCYEGNVAFDRPVVRFNERHVRHAFWQSVMSGATAGFTYGAAGIWLWKDGDSPCSFKGHVGQINDWKVDIKLKGAEEVAFGKKIIEEYGLYNTEPYDVILDNPGKEFVCCASDEKDIIAVYQTYSYPVRIGHDLREYEVIGYDLENKKIYIPRVSFDEGYSLVEQAPYNYDVLLLAKKRQAQS